MSNKILKEVIEEEIERKKRALRAMELQISDHLVRSKVVIKTIDNNQYYYVKYQNEDNEVEWKSVGNVFKISDEIVQKLNVQYNEYKMFVEQAKEIKEDIKELEKVYKCFR